LQSQVAEIPSTAHCGEMNMKKSLLAISTFFLAIASAHAQTSKNHIDTLNGIQDKYWEGSFSVVGLKNKRISCTGQVRVYLFPATKEESFARGHLSVSYRHKITHTSGVLCGAVNHFSPVQESPTPFPNFNCEFPKKNSPVDGGQEVAYRTIVADETGASLSISAPLCVNGIVLRPDVKITKLDLSEDGQTLILQILPFRGAVQVTYELHRNDQKLEDFKSGKIPADEFNSNK